MPILLRVMLHGLVLLKPAFPPKSLERPAASGSAASASDARSTKRTNVVDVSAQRDDEGQAAADTNMEELYKRAMESGSESQRELLQEINESGLYPRRLNASATQAATDERKAEAKLAKALSKQLPGMGAACAAYLDALKESKRRVTIEIRAQREGEGNAVDDANNDSLFRSAMESASPPQKAFLQEIKEFGFYPRRLSADATHTHCHW